MNDKILTWSEEYSVNVKEIDEQHKKLVATINDLSQAISQGDVAEKLSGIFDNLGAYAVEHFATEEKYFEMFHYSEAQEHIAKHNEFKQKIGEIKDKLSGNAMQISFELIDFLEDWLLDHLKAMDKKYTKCFNDNGLF